jgi:hypothetical protein
MECGWILTGLAGREVSFVTTPSAPLAGVRDTKTEEAEAAEIVSFERMALIEQTKEDDKLMAAVESAVLSEKTGSPVIVKDDESNVPSEKEEGDVTKNARLTDEEEAAKAATKSEVEESSDATPEGEESTTETDETEDADLDGTAETETEDEEVDKTAESDDSTTESDEEVSDGADLSSDGADNGSESESDEDLSESETEIEATDADDTTGEREELLVRVSELEAEVVSLKAELYVETGLADGILTGERDSLIEMHEGMAESSLDDLLGRLRERRSSVGSPSEKLRGLVKNDKATRTDDDKNADDKVTSGTTVSVRTEQGSHSVTVNDDDDTVITVTPKL